jgi:hypothetical protein
MTEDMQLSLFVVDWSMQTVYLICAAFGGTVLVIQTLLLLFGLGHGDLDVPAHDVDVSGHDLHGDHGSGGFGLFSIRALASFFTFFGLGGLLGASRGWDPLVTVIVATAAGGALMLAVAWLFRLQGRLQSRGNLDPRNAVGLSARVYLRVPPRNSGVGKVSVKVQGRTAEFQAFTQGEELPTGALVKLTRLSTPDTFEVVPLREE